MLGEIICTVHYLIMRVPAYNLQLSYEVFNSNREIEKLSSTTDIPPQL